MTIKLGAADLNYLLAQVNIGNDYSQLNSPLDPLGVREVSGSNNNLVGGFDQDGNWVGGNINGDWGEADTDFLRLFTTDHPNNGTSYGITYNPVVKSPVTDANGVNPGDPGWIPTFVDNPMGSIAIPDAGASPRLVTQLIASSDVDPLSPTYNPAAAAAMEAYGGGAVDVSNSVVGTSETASIPNPGILGGVPYNEWFVAFGQFFDHGLDFISKGGGYVMIELSPSDPLYVDPSDPAYIPGASNVMMLSRASLANPADDFNADGTLKAGAVPQFNNNTGLLIDQSQTYGSHAAVNVLVRQYDANGVVTGKLITGAEDGNGSAHELATWADMKVNALRIGVELTDADVLDAPALRADAVGQLLFDPQQTVLYRSDMSIADMGADYNAANDPFYRDSDGNVLHSNQAILADIAFGADPSQPGYDPDALAAHYVSGDGRVNENVGLTSVHHVFHEEHNIQADQIEYRALELALKTQDITALNGTVDQPGWLATNINDLTDIAGVSGLDLNDAAAVTAFLADATSVTNALASLTWDGEKIYQAARIITESEYNHIAIDQYVTGLYPALPEFVSYSADINMSISLEFSQAVFRLGHSMLTETMQIAITDSNGNNPGDPGYVPTYTNEGLFDAFLNPALYDQYGAAGIALGLINQQGNEVDEFVTAGVQQSLLGVPLDLPALNIARGRDVGLPTLNELRQQVFDGLVQNTSNNANASGLAPYTSWADFGGHLRTPESLVNFIAAYGRENDVFGLQDIRAAYQAGTATLADVRAAAQAILDASTNAADANHDAAVAFMQGAPVYNDTTGQWEFTTGDMGFWDIDLWIGGLAEQPLFDGPLGTTFSFIMLDFAQRLQDGDRFYYLYRMPVGQHLGDQIIGEQFADLVMRTTGLEHINGDVFGYSSGTFILDGGNNYFNAILENLPDKVTKAFLVNSSFEAELSGGRRARRYGQ